VRSDGPIAPPGRLCYGRVDRWGQIVPQFPPAFGFNGESVDSMSVNIMRSLLMTVLLCVQIGCAAGGFGRDFDSDVVRTFEVGVTHKSDVLGALGPPLEIATDQHGNETWTYAHNDVQAMPMANYTFADMGVQSRLKTAVLQFHGDVLDHVTLHVPPRSPHSTSTSAQQN
jgi:hypothetical protein